MDVHWGWVNENCFTESENAALKGDVSGPKANNKLNSSVDATLQHLTNRYTKLTTKAFKEYTRTSVVGETVSVVHSDLSRDLNGYVASSLSKQWNRRTNYYALEGKCICAIFFSI